MFSVLKHKSGLLRSGHGDENELPMEEDSQPVVLLSVLLVILVAIIGTLLFASSAVLQKVVSATDEANNAQYGGKQLAELRAKDEGRLNGYSQKTDGKYTIPVQRAMTLLVSKGGMTSSSESTDSEASDSDSEASE